MKHMIRIGIEGDTFRIQYEIVSPVSKKVNPMLLDKVVKYNQQIDSAKLVREIEQILSDKNHKQYQLPPCR